LFATLDDFRRLGFELCADLAATGVPYAEAVFSPGNHARRLDGDWFGPLEVAVRFAGRGVVSLNCAGSERTGVERFAWMFRKAARAGLRSVPHAGEWAGPENVRATIEHLRPDRIGHGVRAVE